MGERLIFCYVCVYVISISIKTHLDQVREEPLVRRHVARLH